MPHEPTPLLAGPLSPPTRSIRANRKKLGFLEVDRKEMDVMGVPWWYEPDPTPEL